MNEPCPKCGSDLKELTVKKEGPNKGRKFQSCNSCDHFQWMSAGGAKLESSNHEREMIPSRPSELVEALKALVVELRIANKRNVVVKDIPIINSEGTDGFTPSNIVGEDPPDYPPAPF